MWARAALTAMLVGFVPLLGEAKVLPINDAIFVNVELEPVFCRSVWLFGEGVTVGELAEHVQIGFHFPGLIQFKLRLPSFPLDHAYQDGRCHILCGREVHLAGEGSEIPYMLAREAVGFPFVKFIVTDVLQFIGWRLAEVFEFDADIG
ncbi:hypothetical protein FJ414_23810 [Mesorhizobium sp. B3-1-6]|uniref:hypothetical protein n=1 Tax=Mesorhizobium sp. B3-1-6 TaxID=2589895 RepID=UPI001129192A|nr:hypothetical protein [Mesorhizobium sp. B3-1-6]TPI31154.1 hypothetical protein FJ414_23810 [Mesorhizobium sp. B3-1-6]